ncbi:nuclear transport factor 2 family protein [Algoriphagus sp. CAU 1675]|uniref:nuclear transport factor 2 family protein n=1 Tax=Algoriphagus sp. CAU 1675 TaxID=3032597 RepID=UPI0023DC1575|nr:nuclear transport factor 2 family protein [Algoriphagus sp. CAU 1675]MDF2157506.1 nuclear transport factor 2 family protein [Algoriphagus sp. CAU 1675]
MKSILSICFIILQTVSFAQSPEQQLQELDQSWERALLSSDVEVLENLLADEFVWVHNHAGLIDGKEAVINRAKRIQAGQKDDTRNRTPRDQQVVILGKTGIVSGFTVVDRGPTPTTYHFMRSYTWMDGKWKLLGNHTMAIPEEELK